MPDSHSTGIIIVQDIEEGPQTKAFIIFWKEFSPKFDSIG